MKRLILQRYVLKELGGPTVLGLIVFTFVLLTTHLFRLMDLLINRGVPFPMFAGLVGTLLPPLIILTIPMALLVGVLLGVGRLAADNEIMAMRTSGVNLVRVFVPILLVGALLTGTLFSVNGGTVPVLLRFNSFLIDQIKFIVASNMEAGRVFKPESSQYDVWLHFRRRNPLKRSMDGITLRVLSTEEPKIRDKSNPKYVPPKQRDIIVTAREGVLNAAPLEGFMDVELTSGTMHYFDSLTTMAIAGVEDFRYSMVAFNRMTWRLQLDDKDKNDPTQAEQMTSGEIEKEIDSKPKFSREGSLLAELYQRRSIPWACLSFVLLGVPLAIRVRPTGKGVAFGIAFGLIFFYYVMLKWGTSLTQDGSSLGVVIIFLPNIIISVVGVYLFFRILRQ